MYFNADNVQQTEIQTKSHALLLNDSATLGTYLHKTAKYPHRQFYVLLQLTESFALSKKQSIDVSKVSQKMNTGIYEEI